MQQRMVMVERAVFDPLLEAAERWIEMETKRLAMYPADKSEFAVLGRATKALETYAAQRRIAGE